MRVFFTPTNADGVTIHDDWSGFGQRTTASGTTEFDDVWVPDELCLASPDSDGGGGGAVTSLNYQAVHTGVFVGIARNPSTTPSSSSRPGPASGTRATPPRPARIPTPCCGSAR